MKLELLNQNGALTGVFADSYEKADTMATIHLNTFYNHESGFNYTPKEWRYQLS